MNIIRLFSSSVKNISSGELAQLRRRTGFSLVNCRNALKLNNNDVAKAEEWLKSEALRLGWEKAMKLEKRIASQGLIAIGQTKNKLVMAEINCETDFVAKNEKFASLCEVVAKTCLSHPHPELTKNTKQILYTDQLETLKTTDNEKLSDFVVKCIAEFGEKILLRRALFYEADNDVKVDFTVHPPYSNGGEIHTGKFGAFVVYQKLPGFVADGPVLNENLGVDLCKHIIGMNPREIGSPDDPPPENDLNAKADPSQSSEHDSDTDEMISNFNSKTGHALIHQDFLLDSDSTVGEILNENGVKVIDFHRFQCGEDNENLESEAEGKIKMRSAEGN